MNYTEIRLRRTAWVVAPNNMVKAELLKIIEITFGIEGMRILLPADMKLAVEN
jgi:hypothetical protein